MNLTDTINQNLKEAMKAKDAVTLSTLRLLSSAIKNKQIASQKELTDEEIAQVVSSQIKQRKDSIEQYQKGNRDELAAKEEVEINILKKYLPEQLTEAEIKKLIQDSIKKIGAQGPQDMGKVMGILMNQIKDKADGSQVSELVKQVLSNK